MNTGPDGAMWYADVDPGENRIGRMTPSGEATFFEDADLSAPWSIAVGPEGDLWFPAGTDDIEFGALTTDGTFRFCRVRDSSNTPYHLVHGPDDTPWLSSGSVVLRIDSLWRGPRRALRPSRPRTVRWVRGLWRPRTSEHAGCPRQQGQRLRAGRVPGIGG